MRLVPAKAWSSHTPAAVATDAAVEMTILYSSSWDGSRFRSNPLHIFPCGHQYPRHTF